MPPSSSTFRYPLLLLLLLVSSSFPSASCWLWRNLNTERTDDHEEAFENPHRHGSGLDLSGLSRNDDGLPRSSLMKQGQSMVSSSTLEASCWQKAYKKLLSSCHAILKDEEKKCRLAYEFTDCFLRMTGWPPPPKCSDKTLVKYCTQKVDAHTHGIYHAFFVEADAMCHHLQNEAFRQETSDIVNDLKQTGHWMLDKVKEVESLSHEILDDALQQSSKLEEKLSTMQTMSQTLLAQNEQFDNQLKSTLGTVEAVFEHSQEIKDRQMELKELHQDMNKAMSSSLKDLKIAAQQTHQQLDGISEGNKELAEQQLRLADALASNIERLKESALRSLDDLKESQTLAMDETRLSLQDLSDGAQRARANFDLWRVELDDRNKLLLKGSEAILHAQEAFVMKQGSILSTLDRMFSLYDNILYESRALKLFVFYGTLAVFIHVLTSAKQTNNARGILYAGLFISIAVEVYVMKAYGSIMHNQQWIQTVSYWSRSMFALFTATVILYFVITFRDISWQNHILLVELDKKLNAILSQSINPPYIQDVQLQPAYSTETFLANDRSNVSWITASCSAKQDVASKIIHRAKTYFRGGSNCRKQEKTKSPKGDDIFKAWMVCHGIGSSSLLEFDNYQGDDHDDDKEDPDYVCPFDGRPTTYKGYNLRSLCKKRSCIHSGFNLNC